MYEQGRAIILKGMDYRDSDKILTLFTEQQGKIKAIARGVKKPRSSLRACVQPFCLSFLHLRQGKEMDLITQGKLLSFYGNIREDLNLTLQAVYMMEIIDKAALEKASLKSLFAITLEVLENMNDKGWHPLLIRYFELQLLIALGYQPVWDHCSRCNRIPLSAGFHIGLGGMLCQTCISEVKSAFSLSGESLGILQRLTQPTLPAVYRIKASSETLVQIEWFLEKYMEYHLEKSFKMKDTIRNLKKVMEI